MLRTRHKLVSSGIIRHIRQSYCRQVSLSREIYNLIKFRLKDGKPISLRTGIAQEPQLLRARALEALQKLQQDRQRQEWYS